MVEILKPPASLDAIDSSCTVFLAGSIEMGTADDWQAVVSQSLKNTDLTILNPRRDDWNASWEQEKSNPLFREQVEWELSALEQSAMIAMYFAPSTKSPVTLLELGLFAKSGKLVVCCPDGFWRKGNIEIVCVRYAVSMVDTLEELTTTIRSRFNL